LTSFLVNCELTRPMPGISASSFMYRRSARAATSSSTLDWPRSRSPPG
jgi:hypothetical protein